MFEKMKWWIGRPHHEIAQEMSEAGVIIFAKGASSGKVESFTVDLGCGMLLNWDKIQTLVAAGWKIPALERGKS